MTAYRSLMLDVRRPGLELDGGELIGRDPRELTTEELRGLGHESTAVLRVIRERCLDCCAEQASEVRKCTSVGCPSWPFWMGTNPWRASVSEAQRAAAVEAGKRLAGLRNGLEENGPNDLGVVE